MKKKNCKIIFTEKPAAHKYRQLKSLELEAFVMSTAVK